MFYVKVKRNCEFVYWWFSGNHEFSEKIVTIMLLIFKVVVFSYRVWFASSPLNGFGDQQYS